MDVPHDPYLVTVKRSFDEERILKRKKRLEAKQKKEIKESYFSKKINLNQILELPEGLQHIVLFIFFLLIPYSTGLLFALITRLDIVSLNSQGFNEFLFLWTIGYEFSATMLLIFLFQQSFTYRRGTSEAS